MNVYNKMIVLALVAIMLLAAIPLYASLGEGADSAYSPEGAWLVNGVVAGQLYIWMDIYTSNSKNPAVSGTVLCTLPAVSGITPTGHGNWVRIGKNTFAFTALRILIDLNGNPFGTAKFWGTVSVDEENKMSGTMNVQYYDFDDDAISPVLQGISTAKRIEIKLEEAQ
jgi:hypothetical protein